MLEYILVLNCFCFIMLRMKSNKECGKVCVCEASILKNPQNGRPILYRPTILRIFKNTSQDVYTVCAMLQDSHCAISMESSFCPD